MREGSGRYPAANPTCCIASLRRAGSRWPRSSTVPAVGRDHAEQHQQGRGLAGAVRPEQRDPLPGRDGEVDPGDGLSPPERLHQPLRSDDELHEGAVSPVRGAGPRCLSNVRRPGSRRRLSRCKVAETGFPGLQPHRLDPSFGGAWSGRLELARSLWGQAFATPSCQVVWGGSFQRHLSRGPQLLRVPRR